MMTLKEIREDYVRYSSNVSNLCRSLSYAGIGIVWIFKQTHSGKKLTNGFMQSIPDELRWVLALFVAVLIVDLLQYVIQTSIWYVYYYQNKKQHIDQKEEDVVLNEPEVYNFIPWACWFIKVIIVAIAYSILGCFLLN